MRSGFSTSRHCQWLMLSAETWVQFAILHDLQAGLRLRVRNVYSVESKAKLSITLSMHRPIYRVCPCRCVYMQILYIGNITLALGIFLWLCCSLFLLSTIGFMLFLIRYLLLAVLITFVVLLFLMSVLPSFTHIYIYIHRYIDTYIHTYIWN